MAVWDIGKGNTGKVHPVIAREELPEKVTSPPDHIRKKEPLLHAAVALGKTLQTARGFLVQIHMSKVCSYSSSSFSVLCAPTHPAV